MCVAQMRVLFLSLSGSGWGESTVCNKNTGIVRRSRLVGVLKRLYQKMPYLPLSLLNFLVHLFGIGLAWHTINTYHSAI